jgi:hypothetical protein
MDMTVSKTDEKVYFDIKATIDENGAEELKHRFHELDRSVQEASFNLEGVTTSAVRASGKHSSFTRTWPPGAGRSRSSKPLNPYWTCCGN